jgi:hypothetical protein
MTYKGGLRIWGWEGNGRRERYTAMKRRYEAFLCAACGWEDCEDDGEELHLVLWCTFKSVVV